MNDVIIVDEDGLPIAKGELIRMRNEEVVDRFMLGESLSCIAREMEIDRATVRKVLNFEVGDARVKGLLHAPKTKYKPRLANELQDLEPYIFVWKKQGKTDKWISKKIKMSPEYVKTLTFKPQKQLKKLSTV